ncbi:hypothetical protein BHE74_00032647 [Ensete ventricosum]|nr:hypothetical protein BHE74_00032647 [Ensete ventricosum]RZR87714.1 hypothetical protein BHM03_00015172 [Ensete ventricosum]
MKAFNISTEAGYRLARSCGISNFRDCSNGKASIVPPPYHHYCFIYIHTYTLQKLKNLLMYFYN